MENNVKLFLNIKNNDPVNLIDFAIGLNSFARLYSDFNNGNSQAKLLIKEVRKGSIEIDLISVCTMSAIPLISDVNNIIQFCNFIKFLTKRLIGVVKGKCSKKDPQEQISKITADNLFYKPTMRDFSNFKDTINILQNSKDTFGINAVDINTGNTYVNCNFNGQEAVQMKEAIKEITKETEDNSVHTKQLFKWSQVNFDSYKTGNKGTIEKVSTEPLRIIFNDHNTKISMTTSTNNTDWQKNYYIVDAEVMLSEGKPKIYKILRSYPEESFPIDEG